MYKRYTYYFNLTKNIRSCLGGGYLNQTEYFITKIYRTLKISDPLIISKEIIVDLLKMKLVYWPHTSAIVEYENKYCVFIKETLNKQQQWQEFGHEMSHYFNDRINRKSVSSSFVNYCEVKADYFAYHFCVPTFMLLDLEEITAHKIMNLFNVEFDFAIRRIEMFKNKIINKGVL